MRKFGLMLLLVFGLCAQASAQARPEISRYIKAYKGGEGIVVWILRVGPLANQEALVQVNGIDNKLDRRIQKLKIEPTQRGVKYVLAADGKRYDMLVVEPSGIDLHVPGMPGQASIAYDEATSAQGNPEHFLTEYLAQKN